MVTDLPAIERLVYGRWGGHKLDWAELEKALGWSPHCAGIAAVSTQRPKFGLPPEFHLTSYGPLFEALSAGGAFTLPDAEWLLSPLSADEKAALDGSPNGWEAYSFRRWKPHTRAEALFTHWD